MPRYLIVYAERRGDDTVIEDPHLTIEFKDRDLFEPDRVAVAIPAAQVQRIERVDEDQNPDQEPAPQKE